MDVEVLWSWLTGDLTRGERIFSALAPAILLLVYFVGGLASYGLRCLVRGPYCDAELDYRTSSPILGRWLRRYFAWVMRPVWGLLLLSGLPASAVTILSVLLALGAGVSLAMGRFALGGWLFISSGICDFLDGRLARHRGEVSSYGAALDSVLDRYAETFVLAGLAWYYREHWALLAVLAALGGSGLVPYIRAKAEAAGVELQVGLARRPERILILGLSVALSPVMAAVFYPGDTRPVHWLAVAGLVLLAVLSNTTALHRLVALLRALQQPEEAAAAPSAAAQPAAGGAAGDRQLAVPAVSGGRSRPRAAAGGSGQPDDASWWGLGQGSIIRNVVASAIATAVDFMAVVALVSGAELLPWLATGLGCGLGGVANYSINRIWTFGSHQPPLREASRYGVVSVTSALLNAGGVAILLLIPVMDYRLAWLLTRITIFVAWNYPLHRWYVFGAQKAALHAR